MKRFCYMSNRLRICVTAELSLVLALNMMDVAEGLGISIDVAGLSRELGAPIVAMAITQGRGQEELFDAIADMSRSGARTSLAAAELYPELKDALRELEKLLERAPSLKGAFPLSWLAVKLMEERRQFENESRYRL